MSTLQAVVLRLFDAEAMEGRGDTKGYMSYERIKEISGVAYSANSGATGADPLRIIIDSMSKVDPGQRFIVRTPPSPTVAGECYQVNAKLTSKLNRVKASSLNLDKADKVEKEATEDKKWMIEAAVVRTAKARRTISHTDLMAEVLRQLDKFRPEVKLIKERIEGLIERGYLERNRESAQTYNYLA